MKIEQEETRQNFYCIKVNNSKESKEIQEILFSIGLKWASGGAEVLYQEEQDMNGIFITITKDSIGITRTISNDGWISAKKDTEEEITLKKLRSKRFQMKLKKLMILNRLEDEN